MSSSVQRTNAAAGSPDAINQHRPEIAAAGVLDFGYLAGLTNAGRVRSTGQTRAAVPTCALGVAGEGARATCHTAWFSLQ